MKTVTVWDFPTRIFHWSLVFFFSFSYLSGDELEDFHSYSGYIIIGLLIFRVIWGFIGSPYARFSSFIYPPNIIIEYTQALLKGNPKHYYGHNPLGGLMVFALLGALALTTFTGLQAYAVEGNGPLASIELQLVSSAMDDDKDGKHEEEDEFWEEVHEFFSTLTLILVLLHISGVVISSKLHKENLAKAMVSGQKQVPPED